MKAWISSIAITASLITAGSGVTSPAFAHDYRGGYGTTHRGYEREHWGYARPYHGYTPAPQAYGQYYDRGPGVVYYGGQYPGYRTYNGRWQPGGYLPSGSRSAGYYVQDYGRYGNLYAPPRGYGWYRTDSNDYILAAIATGLIVAIIANQ